MDLDVKVYVGCPNGNYFIQCVAAHHAAVHSTHMNCDGELVIQPRLTEPGLTEQPCGKQPLSLTIPGHPCLKPGVLPVMLGRSLAQCTGV